MLTAWEVQTKSFLAENAPVIHSAVLIHLINSLIAGTMLPLTQTCVNNRKHLPYFICLESTHCWMHSSSCGK